MSTEGLFIVIDGPSGSGKDSIIKKLLENLHRLSLKTASIQETKEPNYNRKKILQANKAGDKKAAQAIVGERQKLYLIKIRPMLEKGVLVIANRGEPSTLVYQALKQKISMEGIWTMHRKANIPLPDLTVILNCDVTEALQRQHLREDSQEEKDKKFMSGKFSSQRQRIHASYEKLPKFLENKGLSILYLKNDKISIEKQSKIILENIKQRSKRI